MVAGDCAEPARRACHRDLQPFGQLEQVAGGAAVFDALAHQDGRPLRRDQHVDGTLDAIRIGAAAARDVGVPFLRLRGLFRRRLLEDVERHVDHDRPRATGYHGLPSLAHRKRHHFAARRLEHAFAHGPDRGGEIRLVMTVELLEGAAVELAGRNVAGHRQEWNRIEERVGERDRQVGRTRAARGERGGRLAGNPVVAVGHEPSHGLVVDRDRLDVVPPLVKGIDELDVAMPAQAERIGHLLANEVVDDDLCTVEHVLRHRECFSWLTDWSGAQSIEGLPARQV